MFTNQELLKPAIISFILMTLMFDSAGYFWEKIDASHFQGPKGSPFSKKSDGYRNDLDIKSSLDNNRADVTESCFSRLLLMNKYKKERW